MEGELDTWQVGFRVHRTLAGDHPYSAFKAILDLSLSWSRDVLKDARHLMKEFSPGYRFDQMPFYPLHKEAVFWETGNEPK